LIESTRKRIRIQGKDNVEVKNLESFTLIWCDTDVNLTEENRQMQTELRKSINFLKIFESDQECKQYIQQQTEQKIVLIVSDRTGKMLIPQIHNCTQVVAIYYYEYSNEKQLQWLDVYKKVSRKVVALIQNDYT
jgi:hypothetical protein